MKVLFFSINSKYIHSSLAPWCLFTACRKYCCKEIIPEVSEGTVNEKDEALLSRILSYKSDAVAFSCYIWNIKRVLTLCDKIKKANPDTIIILGGPEVSYCQEQLLREHSSVDYVLSGEGEVTVPKLLNNIYLGSCTDIPALSYRTQEGFHIDERQPEADESISPYCQEYFNTLEGRIAYIESSRGCPFRCAFCLSGRLGDVRYIELERVKNEMVHLAAMGAKTIKFVDRTFNCHKKRAAELLNFIYEQYGRAIPEGVCFHFEIAADLLDEALFDIIGKLPVGSVQFEVGIQSFNEATLKAINRKSNLKKVTENVEKLLSIGNCHIHIDLIAGLPEESYESFIEGFNKAYALKANMLQLGFLKILKGSDMAENRDKYPGHYSAEPPYEVISTPFITSEELQKLHKAENELERLYNSGRFTRTLDYVLKATGITPYALFYGFALHLEAIGEKRSIPLDRYTNLAFDYFVTLDGTDKTGLRNAMIYDRIATNNSGVIPERLKVADINMKKIRNLIKESDPINKGVNRTVAILYGEGKAVYCDYENRNPVTGEYNVKEFLFADDK